MADEHDFLIAQNQEKPVEPPPEKISDYIHLRRVLPPGTPMPGPMDLDYTPFFKEIQDTMGPFSGISTVSVCKSVQVGATANCAENVIAYYMDANPAEILYASATQELLEKWNKRLEPLIDSCGYRWKIAAQVENKKTKKTGDKVYSKEYPGGSLSMASLQSPAALRSESKRILVIDEIDAAPAKLTTGEGSPLFVLHGRAAAFGSRSKFMEFSTPSTFENSVIWKRYLQGDQRRYYVPCPHCGFFQVLEFKNLRPEYSAGVLDYAWYKCEAEKCGKKIRNFHKTEMFKAGEWRPTATAVEKNRRSYHISALYSPAGMTSWTELFKKNLSALENPEEMPSFVNLMLGLPYQEVGARPDVKNVILLKGDYKNGTVPKDVLYLTMAADVQRGGERYQAMSPEELEVEIAGIRAAGRDPWKAGLPRIELEVFGIGKAYKSWSIDYKVFYGHTTKGPYGGAFEKIYKCGENLGFDYKRQDGKEFWPQIFLIDATDGITQPAVFEFCERFGAGTFPTINRATLKLKQDPNLDMDTPRSRDRYRLEKNEKTGAPQVIISTTFYKKTLYQRLGIRRNPIDPQPPGFCSFPMDRDNHYFDMLTGEEMRTDGSFYSGGRAVEALDCRVYALCGADVWLESKVREAQARAQKKGLSDLQVKKIDKKVLLDRLANGV